MAKKKKTKISLSNSNNLIVPIKALQVLPPYSRFIDSPDHSFRLFFELPHNESEVIDSHYPYKKYIGSGKYSKGIKKGFLIMSDGSALAGDDIAKTFAQLVIKKISNQIVSKSSVGNYSRIIKQFLSFIASLDSPPTLFNQLTYAHFSNWLYSFSKASVERDSKAIMKVLLDLHPISKSINLGNIITKERSKNVKDLNQIDFDKITEQYDYSDKVLFQILAYTFYDIEESARHFSTLETVTIESLQDDYINILDINVKNKTIPRLLESGVGGHRLLLKNIYICIQREKLGHRLYKSAPDYSIFMGRLRETSQIIYKNKYNYCIDFEEFLFSQTWSPLPKVASRIGSKIGTPKYIGRMAGVSWHHELSILIYTMITIGLNLETILNWKWNINNKPWYDNYDVELGINDKSSQRNKSVVLVGKKHKGQGASKIITTAININSPLFKYLKFLDKTRPDNREYIFTIKDVNSKLQHFSYQYPIINDDGSTLSSIETKRLRKVFAGQKLISLLKNVKSADELVEKLKNALSHNVFDTTLFSYILKSGMGNLVINSAIVALTSDLLEKALLFKGQIKEDIERSKNTQKVFLCDCSDSKNPTHGLPIADRCRKYDMCLGCERSEVYSEHLPTIFYRIMQYEDMKINTPETFNVTLEDRLQIAKNTVEQFKTKHKDGIEIVENSYNQAVEAVENNICLLPPILQTGSI